MQWHVDVDKALRNTFSVRGSDHGWCAVWIMVCALCLVALRMVHHLIMRCGYFNCLENEWHSMFMQRCLNVSKAPINTFSSARFVSLSMHYFW